MKTMKNKSQTNKKDQVSFDSIVKVACPPSQRWLKDKRPVGLRKLIRLVFARKAKWMNRGYLEPINHVCGLSNVLRFEGYPFGGNLLAAYKDWQFMWHNASMGNGTMPTCEELIAVLDKYKIKDEFSA